VRSPLAHVHDHGDDALIERMRHAAIDPRRVNNCTPVDRGIPADHSMAINRPGEPASPSSCRLLV